jgi:5-deoxy-glucuronate isomerase
MSELLLRPTAPDADGCIHRVTPASAGWAHVGFEVYRLRDGQRLARRTEARETCLVLLSGRADVEADGEAFPGLGGRASVFEGAGDSVYVGAGRPWSVTAVGAVELAVCTAPGTPGRFPSVPIPAAEVGLETRGKGTNVRHVRNILPDTDPRAESLLVVEVITPPGHWSSYPPHKHDVDAPPEETRLEETYYHRLDPAQGFAFQRVYTDDRALDVAMTVQDGDVVLVPRGYHPCAAAHGYELYYLNVMAGPKRLWRFNTEPDHRWLLG